jgi:hypothetical protein
VGARKDYALRSIRTKFADWRRTRRVGESIPPALWDEVHALEEHVGRSRLALYLGLNASELASQMNLRTGSKPPAGGPQPVEAPTSRVATSTIAITKVVSVPLPPSPSRKSAAVEIESPSGWILRLQPDASPDFVRAFVEATGRLGGGA